MNAPLTFRQLAAHEVAIARIESVLAAGQPAICAYSGGRDSSVLVSLTLEAATRLKASGAVVPPVLVVSSDTGIENPEVEAARNIEMRRMETFAAARGLRFEAHIAHPNLNDTWAVRVISGRALPSFASSRRDCTVSWKIKPLQKLQRSLVRRLAEEWNEPVVLIGTRLDESAARARNMKDRGDDAEEPRRNDDGILVFAPIAHLSTDDVWEVIGLAASGLFKTYSIFEELKEIYASAGASECALVGDAATQELKAKRPCSARTGCSLCLVVGENDQSLDAMIATSDRYQYMEPLQRLRTFLFRTRYDLNRRAWVGRTIDDEGYIAVGPDSYSPGMTEELLRYCLTIDTREEERAAAAGEEPRFRLVSLEQLFAIDFHWSVQGFHRPFHALSIWRDVARGARYDVPDVELPPQQSIPAPRRLRVGEGWLGEAEAFGGLRDLLLESFEECGRSARALRDGTVVTGYDVEEAITVDAEGAYLFLEFELDRVLRAYHDVPRFKATTAALEYLHYGFVRIAGGSQAKVSQMLKRTAWRHERGLTGAQCGNGRHLWEAAEEQATNQLSLFGGAVESLNDAVLETD